MSDANFDQSFQSGSDRTDHSLITAERVRGTAVYNTAGEKLGSVDSIMIDKVSGRVEYVVMSFGGFLGIGEDYHPLPWDVLDYDTGLGGYRVELDRAKLEGAPAYNRNDVDNFDYDTNRSQIDDYYGVDIGRREANRDRGTTNRGVAAIEGENRSDANDGRDRPLGYFSSTGQAERNADNTSSGMSSGSNSPGVVKEGAEKTGFYSADQQSVRNTTPEDIDNVRGRTDDSSHDQNRADDGHANSGGARTGGGSTSGL